jgi:hypothetical protein
MVRGAPGKTFSELMCFLKLKKTFQNEKVVNFQSCFITFLNWRIGFEVA